eukprot:GDKJ01017293.1.p1 GENE.GDKJ01017293.1~~GDKJ01017293.1.p1  ORF type:complete len:482 (+),score=121.16 GDKJ01017293.1:2-1447(+)
MELVSLADILAAETAINGHHYLAFRLIQVAELLGDTELAAKYYKDIHLKNAQLECIANPLLSLGLSPLASNESVSLLARQVNNFVHQSGSSIHTAIEDAFNSHCQWLIHQFHERNHSCHQSSAMMFAQTVLSTSAITQVAKATVGTKAAEPIFGSFLKFLKSSSVVQFANRPSHVYYCEKFGSLANKAEITNAYLEDVYLAQSTMNTAVPPHNNASTPASPVKLITQLEARVPYPIHSHPLWSARQPLVAPSAESTANVNSRAAAPSRHIAKQMDLELWMRHCALIALVAAVASTFVSESSTKATAQSIASLTQNFKSKSTKATEFADKYIVKLLSVLDCTDNLSLHFSSEEFPQLPSDAENNACEHGLTIDAPMMAILLGCVEAAVALKGKKAKDEKQLFKNASSEAKQIVKWYIERTEKNIEDLSCTIMKFKDDEMDASRAEGILGTRSWVLKKVQTNLRKRLEECANLISNWKRLFSI